MVGGEVKLLDFGIAVDKDEETELGGSVEYMAPELLRGAPPNAGSDLYAVGILFYQMLTGSSPPATDSRPDLLSSPLGGSPASGFADFDFDAAFPEDGSPGGGSGAAAEGVSPQLPGPLGPIVSKLCASSPTERYSDASVVLRELATAVGSAVPVETAATRESFLRANVLIGRDTELSLLSEALEQTKRGVGKSFLISGESGVGKSRLTAELRTLALVHGCWVAEGQSITEGGYYYQEWLPLLRALCFRSDVTDAEASILKDLISDIGELLGRPIPDPPAVKPEAAPARVVSAVVGLLARQQKPVMLILEDIQWARSESLALLAQIARHAPALPILLIATQRSDEGSQVTQTVPELQVIQLTRLDETSIAELSASMLGAVGERPELVAYLARQTEGNVFFLIETVRALAEDAGELQRIGQGALPETVLTSGIERIIERRLEQVSADFRPLLDFAATLGRQLDLPVLEHAFPATPLRPFLIACANAAVLESQGAEWRFAHNKLREHLLQSLPAEPSRALHAKVAYAIEACYSGAALDALAATLAYHFQEAGVLDKALAYYIQAGDIAARLYLLEESRAHYGAAKSALEQLPDTTEMRRLHVDLLLKKVHAGLTNDPSQTQLYRLAEARVLLEALMSDGESIPEDRLRMAKVDYYCGRAYHYGGQPREAIRYYQHVLPIAREFADQELMIMPSYVIGLALCLQGQFGKACELFGQATEPFVEHFGTSLDSIRCLLYYSIALAASGHCPESRALISRILGFNKKLEQPLYRVTYLTLYAVSAVTQADWPLLISLSEQILEIGKQTTESAAQYAAVDFIALAHSNLNRHTPALEGRARAVEMRRLVGGGVIADWTDASEAEILLNAGQTREALTKAQKVAASSRDAGLPFSQAIAERICGAALGRLGADMAEAESHFLISLEISSGADQAMNTAQTELWRGRIWRERGDEEMAQRCFDKSLSQMEAGGYEYALKAAQKLAHRPG